MGVIVEKFGALDVFSTHSPASDSFHDLQIEATEISGSNIIQHIIQLSIDDI